MLQRTILFIFSCFLLVVPGITLAAAGERSAPATWDLWEGAGAAFAPGEPSGETARESLAPGIAAPVTGYIPAEEPPAAVTPNEHSDDPSSAGAVAGNNEPVQGRELAAPEAGSTAETPVTATVNQVP